MPHSNKAITPRHHLLALLEFAASQSSTVFYLIDPAGEHEVRFITSNVETVTGYAAADFLNEPGFRARHVHPDDLPVYEASLAAARASGGLTKPYRFRGRAGAYRWFQDHLRWIDGADARAGDVVGCMIEIAGRGVARTHPRESGDLVRHVLEACPVPITLNRANDGTILYESPAARRLLGYRENQEGRSVVDRWVNPEDRQAYLTLLRRTGAVDGLEIRYKKADGQEFPCALSSRLIDYQGEEVIVSNLVDLTERRESEAELARQRERLHQSEKLSAMGELLAGVSHELNNPLSVLVGQAVMLQEAAPDQQTATRAERVGKAADRCARIVKSFLAMARQAPIEMVPLDLHTVIDGALEVTAYSLRTSGIEVSLRLAKDLPPIMADLDQMRQVLTNLIINAHHALQEVEPPRRLHITASYRRHTNQVVVKVKDNGPGVPYGIRARIFEPLYTTKEVGTGTGMGLALCHRIVEGHGGGIAVEGEPGEGAVFVIRLPRAKEERRVRRRLRLGRQKREACRVLVVDDDDDVARVLSDMLEHDGHTVEIVESGGLALERLRRQRYDVILSDVRMPGMDGPAFYRALRDMRPEQISGLAFITGDTLSSRVKEFLDMSERPYLEKPLAPRNVRELVDLLTRRRMN